MGDKTEHITVPPPSSVDKVLVVVRLYFSVGICVIRKTLRWVETRLVHVWCDLEHTHRNVRVRVTALLLDNLQYLCYVNEMARTRIEAHEPARVVFIP